MAQRWKKLAIVYQRTEERQILNNSCNQKFDKEGSDLNSALSLVEFFKAKGATSEYPATDSPAVP